MMSPRAQRLESLRTIRAELEAGDDEDNEYTLMIWAFITPGMLDTWQESREDAVALQHRALELLWEAQS